VAAAGVAAALGGTASVPPAVSVPAPAHPELCIIVVDVLTQIINKSVDLILTFHLITDN
jgi:hypothetical protein